MGVPIHDAVAAVRFSLGHQSSDADVEHVLRVLPEAIRAASPAMA
jgi:cysteine sulfinate desulfinase/cysteine desulfurase-like protein